MSGATKEEGETEVGAGGSPKESGTEKNQSPRRLLIFHLSCSFALMRGPSVGNGGWKMSWGGGPPGGGMWVVG